MSTGPATLRDLPVTGCDDTLGPFTVRARKEDCKLAYEQTYDSCIEVLLEPTTEKLLEAYDDFRYFVANFGLSYGLMPWACSEEATDRVLAAEEVCGHPCRTVLPRMYPADLDDVGPDTFEAFTFGGFLWGLGYLTGNTLKVSRQSQRFFLTGLLPIKLGDSTEAFTKALTDKLPSIVPENKTIEHIAETWNEFLKAEEEFFLSSLPVPVEFKTSSYSKYVELYQAITGVRTVDELRDLSWYRQHPVTGDARAVFFHPNMMIAEDAWTAARNLLESIVPGSQKSKGSGFITETYESPELSDAYDRASKKLQWSRGVWRAAIGRRNHMWDRAVKAKTERAPNSFLDQFRDPSEDCQPREIIAMYDMTSEGFEVDMESVREEEEWALEIRPVTRSQI